MYELARSLTFVKIVSIVSNDKTYQPKVYEKIEVSKKYKYFDSLIIGPFYE